MKDDSFAKDKDFAKDFIRNYADLAGEPKYMNILQDVANRKIRAIQIDLEDLFNYKDLDEDFFRRVTENTRRYIGVFAEAIDELIPDPTEPFIDDDHDILMTQRSEEGTQNADGSDPHQIMPPEIKRFYEVYIRASSKERPFTIREVKASHIGHLVRISGIVTRCSDVKPLMQVAVYTCEECGFEIYQEVTARVFMPLYECPTNRCKVNNTKGNLILQLRASKFLKFQEAKIQELAEHVPKGHIPRSMTIHFRGELTRKVAPGDVVELSGIFLPIPYTGFRAMRAGLVADTYLEAMSVTHFKKKYEEYELRGDEEEQIVRLAEDGDIYNKLSRSLAPEIFGHEDVKKALLLLLVGAPHRKLKDGMMIRGDLHVCLMGDPGVAKSQLLKHIINVAPRGVYTTGKGSSGVGLTAAVQRDPVTNEMVLEGGALVLADMGICAIDEFDKMEDSDRTAIHEVMEQQTVSIAKAGITTSLNARTAVLAAANPAWGRYDMRRTPAENINLPPALLSRFDLLWLILDRADMDNDLELARHVLYVHQNKESPALGFTPLEASILRAYISMARKVSPTVPRELEEYIASAYSGIRQEEAKSSAPHTYTTVRTLLSILRLSAALARLRFAETVAQSDVDEALRLMQMSKFSLYSDDRQKSGLDAISDIYSILRDEAARSNKMDVSYAHALNWISRKGYSEAQLKECLEEYAALNVWQIHPNTFDIRFIDA
uniref:DNA replication licensing factor MCM7 n=1 Tax=Kalanchoe fedtschenkoi TaxID=63787 RepID=A0A7N0VFL6_KALFE